MKGLKKYFNLRIDTKGNDDDLSELLELKSLSESFLDSQEFYIRRREEGMNDNIQSLNPKKKKTHDREKINSQKQKVTVSISIIYDLKFKTDISNLYSKAKNFNHLIARAR